ncbi:MULTISPECIES: nucleotide sugar dehydrogenase [Bacillus cereus group]|uniref:nucleotide sugar dehydrogenase n=1 Tax=Bacillus cereus group TaxID=86661 RepID=UPI00124E2D07|nr:nucleotide sugar dehydrogenase [Bacillus cereus]KAB2420462.1 nucleotide sugar dehydrogenase [Bacillus cereus]
MRTIKKSIPEELHLKLQKKSAQIGVMGLGYVGLPTALYYVEKGYSVIGFDVSEKIVKNLNKGISHITDISNNQLEFINEQGNFQAVTNMKKIQEMDVIFICVPTPISSTKEPDLTYVKTAGLMIADYVSQGTLVILESTTYPGTTEEYICKPLREKGYTIGEQIFVAFSPERIDPGNQEFSLANTPKVVGGITTTCTDLASTCIGSAAYPVKDVRVAELSKVFENTFRWINIALVNELAILCHELDINVWETIEAASTKPYGFMRFIPGIGVGGHCIPVDPYYLTYKAKEHGLSTKMIEIAGQINEAMPKYTYIRILELLAEQDKLLKKSHIVVLGATYKDNIGDLRESPIMRLIEQLQYKVKTLTIIEPHAEVITKHPNVQVVKSYNSSLIRNSDLVIIGASHDVFYWEDIHNNANLIFDPKNILPQKGYNSSIINTL